MAFFNSFTAANSHWGTSKAPSPIKSTRLLWPHSLTLSCSRASCTVPAVSWQPWCSTSPPRVLRPYIGSRALALFPHYALSPDCPQPEIRKLFHQLTTGKESFNINASISHKHKCNIDSKNILKIQNISVLLFKKKIIQKNWKSW